MTNWSLIRCAQANLDDMFKFHLYSTTRRIEPIESGSSSVRHAFRHFHRAAAARVCAQHQQRFGTAESLLTTPLTCAGRVDLPKLFNTLPADASTMVLCCADHSLEHAASDNAYARNFTYQKETFVF